MRPIVWELKKCRVIAGVLLFEIFILSHTCAQNSTEFTPTCCHQRDSICSCIDFAFTLWKLTKITLCFACCVPHVTASSLSASVRSYRKTTIPISLQCTRHASQSISCLGDCRRAAHLSHQNPGETDRNSLNYRIPKR